MDFSTGFNPFRNPIHLERLLCVEFDQAPAELQTSAPRSSPRFKVHRVSNSNGGLTANVATPSTRIAGYLIYPSTNLVFWLGTLCWILREYFGFSAVDATKGKHVPVGPSGVHRKTPEGAGTRRF